jgi:hypothetical protein
MRVQLSPGVSKLVCMLGFRWICLGSGNVIFFWKERVTPMVYLFLVVMVEGWMDGDVRELSSYDILCWFVAGLKEEVALDVVVKW